MNAKTAASRSAALAALVMILAACGAEDDQPVEAIPDYDPTPEYAGEEAPEAEIDEVRLPYQFQESTLLDPGWDTEPKGAEGVFLAPAEADGVLTFSAVDEQGAVLWEAQRPRSCAGFTITSDGERALAVLTDMEHQDGSFGATTASAYDLQTGEEVWGPVEVPGPHQGPGTVFAAPPEEQMGETGPKRMLDPATGEVLADEAEDDQRVIGEYLGTGLLVDGTELVAISGSGDTVDWSIPLEQFDWDPESVFSQEPTGVVTQPAAMVGAEADELALIDLETGEPIAEGLHDAAYDPATGGWITLGEEFRGYDESGTELFSRAEGEGLRLEGAGAVMVYLRTAENQLQVHNAVTGDIAQGYDPADEGPIALPIHVSETGGGVLSTEQGLLLAPAAEQTEGAPQEGEAP